MTNPILLRAWKVWRIFAYAFGSLRFAGGTYSLITMPEPFDKQWSQFWTYDQGVEQASWIMGTGFLLIVGTLIMDYILRGRIL
jgi:hypothetical protein